MSADLLPDVSKNDVDVMVFSSSPELQLLAVSVASTLRHMSVKTDLVLENKKSKWCFQRADKIGAKLVVMVAPDEMKDGNVVVKNLRGIGDKKQATCPVDDIGQVVLAMLKEGT